MATPAALKETDGAFRLSRVQLHSIGPYFEDAELQIRPITILCGENGSGKSTWIKVLQFIRSAAESEHFPRTIPETSLPLVGNKPTIVNSVVIEGLENRYSSFQTGCKASDEDLRDQMEGGDLWYHNYRPEGEIQLNADIRCPYTSTFKNDNGDSATFSLNAKDSVHVSMTLCAMEGAPDILSEVYVSLISNESNADTLILSYENRDTPRYWVATELIHSPKGQCEDWRQFAYEHSKRDTTAGVESSEDGSVIADACSSFIRSILRSITGTFYEVLANRSCLDERIYENPSEDHLRDELEAIVSSHHVGPFGKNALAIDRALANNMMFQEMYELEGVLEGGPGPHLEVIKRRLYQFNHSASHKEREALYSILNSKAPTREKAELFFDTLSKYPDIVRSVDSKQLYALNFFIRYWMETLLDQSDRFTSQFPTPPSGFLFERDRIEDFAADTHAYDLAKRWDPNRYVQGPLLQPSRASTLSSGFHHVAPIVVQSACMWRGETFAVESPEAHLHPSAQIRLMDFTAIPLAVNCLRKSFVCNV